MFALMRSGFAFAALFACAAAHAQVVTPGTNLVADGIPPVPRSVADSVRAYSEFWPQRALSWHPAKRELLISRRAGDASQVFRVEMPGGKPEQYTSFPDPVSRASYPPAPANHFVFVKDEGGNERYQVWRYDIPDRKTTRLTDPAKRHSGPVWSADGKRIAYTSVAVGAQRDSREVRVEVHVMDPGDPASDRLVVALPGAGWFLNDWSHDGKTLAVSEYVSAVESYIWLLDAQTGEKSALTPDRSTRVAYDGAALSPDGRTLYTSTDRGGEFKRLVAIDVASREMRVLSGDRPWNVEEFDLTLDGAKLAFTTNEDGESRLNIIEPASGRALAMPAMPKGVITGLSWNRQGTELAFNFSSAKEPTGGYSLDLARGQVVRWTIPDTGGADPTTFVEPELVRWKSFDGRTISGYLYRPPARFGGPRPVVVEIHGGPEGQSRPAFYGRYNYFINELGIALLLPNVRGSTGYGKTFLGLDDGMKREDSVRDIGAALDWIGTDARLDAKRVLVSGGSYGGYMSLATATLYNDRIACSIDVVGISNFVSFLTNTESYRRDLRRAEYGDERDPAMRAFLESISPLNRADRIRKPLLVIQGANDPRVPRSEAEQIVRTVRGHGTSVWYLLAMDEGHGFAKKSNADFAFYTRVMFSEQCFK
ncbi:MAG TPA: S9 family peptidase [Burkholderiales bacterium]|nr:S9 family peptidase [Burkholderiales bacterium]